MDSKAHKADQESSISFLLDPGPKSNGISSDSSFGSWTSSSDDDDAPPSPVNTSSAASPADITISSISDEENVESILQSLPRERLISLLLSSATRNAGVRRQILRQAQVDPANCKITVRNLPWRITSQELHTFFSQYGEVRDCHVVTDCSSGRSKGFGFVHFLHSESATRALRCPQKRIGNRFATCLLVTPRRHTYHNYQHVKNIRRKIYVARVHPGIDREKLYKFFSKYGEIEEGPIGFDKYTGKSRGYAMFVYKTDDGARRALEEPMKNFEGYLLQCQPGTVNRANSDFRGANHWLNSGPGTGNGCDIAEPPGYEHQQGSWLKCA